MRGANWKGAKSSFQSVAERDGRLPAHYRKRQAKKCSTTRIQSCSFSFLLKWTDSRYELPTVATGSRALLDSLPDRQTNSFNSFNAAKLN